MAQIVTIAQQKGGAGKSTITALLANTFSQDFNLRVLVVDCDLQQSLTHLRAFQQANLPDTKFSYDIVQKPLDDLKPYCTTVFNDYDIIFVDLPGMLYTTSGSDRDVIMFMLICDVVILPVKAGVFDFDSAVMFLRRLREIQKLKTAQNFKMEIASFINMATNTAQNKDFNQQLIAHGFDVLPTKISHLTEYSSLSVSTKSVQKSSVKNARLKREYGDFVDAVYALIEK